MTDNTLQATCKGELPHLSEGKRIGAQIRLTPEEHRWHLSLTGAT